MSNVNYIERLSYDLEKVFVICFTDQCLARLKQSFSLFPPRKLLIWAVNSSIAQSHYCISNDVKERCRSLSRKFHEEMKLFASAFAKGGEIRDTKTLKLARNIVSLQVWIEVSRFSPCLINLSHNKNICCGLKKVVAKSRARIYSEQQILALLLVFHQAHNLSRNKCARVRANQPISALHFFNLHQMFFLRVKLITQGEKSETSTKTCNETMLRDKWRVFVSRLSPP